MFEEWLSVAYNQDRQKTAQRQLVEKLKLLPNDELYKAAMGDPTSKLAYVDGPSDERDSWIGKYKGSPLFQKAVELEKALLQIDMEENQRRAEESAEPKASSDSYERKDAIKLQQRMLDLDLAMESAGVENPEAKEEQGVQLLEQAQQQEAAAGEGNEPHEKAEDAAIQQFRGAQQQEAAAPAKTEVKVGNAMDMRQLALSAGKGLKSVGKHTNKLVHDHPYGTAGLAFVAGHSHGKDAAEEKTAGTLGSDTRRVAPGSNNEVLHGGSTQGNGTLGDYQPTTDDHFGNVSEGLQVNKTAAALSLSNMDGAGRLLAKLAAENPEGHHLRRSLLGNPLSSAIEAKPGHKMESAGKAFKQEMSSSARGAGKGAIYGGSIGSAVGAAAGAALSGGGGLKRRLVGVGKGALLGAGGGGLLGGAVGSDIGLHEGRHGAEASRIHGEHSKHKTAAIPEERAKVHAEVAKKYPALVQKVASPTCHKALVKVAEANKEAGLGTSLVGAGQKALTAGKGMLAGAGGVGGLASKGLGLAKANPLATAGIAGAAGLAGGAMLARPKQASLDLKKLTKGVTQAPLG